MTSLPKTKLISGVKAKRGAQSTTTVDRTNVEMQEIPPQFTWSDLATPFPHIAPGGYIKFYRTYNPNNNELKQGRRASSSSTFLGPLLSHMPEQSPSTKIPLKSHLFHIRTHFLPEMPPLSPTLATSSCPAAVSTSKPALAIIPEASRETMRVDLSDSSIASAEPTTISTFSFKRKLRVTSCPPAIPTSEASPAAPSPLLSPSSPDSRVGLTPSPSPPLPLSSSPPLSSPSRSHSLRRRKRQVLRTPSVQKDFARHARELFNLRIGVDTRTRSHSGSVSSDSSANSNGSSSTEKTSVDGGDTSDISVSEVTTPTSDGRIDGSLKPDSLGPSAVCDQGNDPLIVDAKDSTLQQLIQATDEDEELKNLRDSWVSYQTALSSLDAADVLEGAEEGQL